MNTDYSKTDTGSHLDKVASDILRPVRINKAFLAWMTFLAVALALCLYAYSTQLRKGLIVTGLRDYTSWGMYISNFVFFVATSLVGMLISSVFGLGGARWIKPIARIAEIIAVGFAAVAGLVIISDMGRPERLPYVFMYGRVQSPILWDVTVVTTYFVLSLLLWFFPMIPDLAIAKTRMQGRPAFLVKAYGLLSFKWTHHPEQYKLLFRAVRILLILVIPTAFAIHTVTSWLFAVTLRAGWDSTIFGPYFISGAFVSGTSALIIAMFFFSKNYKLEKYIGPEQFDKIGKVLILVSALYVYFNLNEFLVPAYKMKKFDAIHLHELFAGREALLFWSIQLFGLLIPGVILLVKKMRRPVPMVIIASVVFVASWLKRMIIVVPPQGHPFLPMQNVPHQWMVYTPTITECAVTMAAFLLVIIIVTVLSKLFPVVPIWEMAEESEKESIEEVKQM
ncbi:MAG TPA: NrfD/PsrC family molybdoenzyme membrane anchor subunit [Bacteroidales bacterium]|nr:NrfD/PsrC family molybdoenzyme membrane anchor subunit [Bacteroidales bacterium]